MNRYEERRGPGSAARFGGGWWMPVLLMSLLGPGVSGMAAQSAGGESVAQEVERLNAAMAQAQARIEESQRELVEMRRQLAALQARMAEGKAPAPGDAQASSASRTAESISAAVQDLRERQTMQESQIATHEQTKVESASKYPVKITGLVLLSGFVNTGGVDMPSTPTVAVSGSGSTGASLRQTVLGFDAHGPHLLGARSYADLRVDFDGSTQSGGASGSYTGYYGSNDTLLRLRTAHAGLEWDHTRAYFSLDRPIVSPDSPTSLTAVAEPALAWSGSLWTWNPQLGVAQDVGVGGSHTLRLETALVDTGNAPVSASAASPPSGSTVPPSGAERSRWPGVEARIALRSGREQDAGNHFGVGGYFAPHMTWWNQRFDSWAATADARLLLPAHLQLTASFYRGMGLGGLGAGGYKDYAYRVDAGGRGYYFRALDDTGGWAELKEKLGETVELNAAFGEDNVFAGELRHYAVSGGSVYQNLARNRTYTGNVIFSPSAYLLFSLEYRRLNSSPVVGPGTGTNIIGLGAGYKF